MRVSALPAARKPNAPRNNNQTFSLKGPRKSSDAVALDNGTHGAKIDADASGAVAGDVITFIGPGPADDCVG